LLRLMRVSVDREAKVVRAGLFGFAGGGLAVWREGTGCASVPDGDLARAASHVAPAAPAMAPRAERWPEGDAVDAAAPALAALLADPMMAGPGMRALLVLHRGRIVAERYGEGFDAATPLLGWSMTKTVTAALVGTLVRDGRIAVDRDGLFPAWAGDERRRIAMTHLLAMSSGLGFNEDYGSVTDITRMLYWSRTWRPSRGSSRSSRRAGQEFTTPAAASVLLARLWLRRGARRRGAGLAAPGAVRPLGMHSAVMEADARGTYVGSSHVCHGTRLGAFACLLLQDGQWQGQALCLPTGWCACAPSTAAPRILAGADVAARPARRHAAGAGPRCRLRAACRHGVDERPRRPGHRHRCRRASWRWCGWG
jgi:CubicO group peptidase (beta-lactamase class C family)